MLLFPILITGKFVIWLPTLAAVKWTLITVVPAAVLAMK